MDELKRVLEDLEIPENDIETFIKETGFTKVDDLLLIKEAKQLKDMGISTFKARVTLFSYIDKMRTDLKEQTAEDSAELSPDEMNLLADIIDDKVWLKCISSQTELQFGSVTYTAGIKGAIAAGFGIYAAMQTLRNKIDEYCCTNGIEAPKFFYNLKQLLAQRKSEAFVLLEDNFVDGVPIRASEEEMTKLLDRIQNLFIPAILCVADSLSSWYTDLAEQMTSDFIVSLRRDPSFVCESYVNPSGVYDAAKNLRVAINKTFASDGVQVAAALYTEFVNSAQILNQNELPKYTGFVNHDAVLAYLKLDNIGIFAVESEKNLEKFVLSVLDIENRVTGDNATRFLLALHALIRQIDWSILTGDATDRERYARRSRVSRPDITDNTVPLLAVAQQVALEGQTGPLTTIDGTAVEPIGVATN